MQGSKMLRILFYARILPLIAGLLLPAGAMAGSDFKNGDIECYKLRIGELLPTERLIKKCRYLEAIGDSERLDSGVNTGPKVCHLAIQACPGRPEISCIHDAVNCKIDCSKCPDDAVAEDVY